MHPAYGRELYILDGSPDTGPPLWNKLPASLRSSDRLCQLFRRQSKTFFVCQGL